MFACNGLGSVHPVLSPGDPPYLPSKSATPQELGVILTLWTNTSRKALVRRRFFLIYPQAVSVVVGHNKAPIVAGLDRGGPATMGAVTMRSMLRKVAENRLVVAGY